MQKIEVLNILPSERQALLELLESLTDSEWQNDTVCPGWSVKDIALHLLHDDVRQVQPKKPSAESRNSKPMDWQELVGFINKANNEWVKNTRAINNNLLVQFLRTTGESTLDDFSSTSPDELGRVVSWAGPDPAPNWLHTAREYTERWVHQQQIRDAVSKPGLKEVEFTKPLIDTFMLALPYSYREMDYPVGSTLQVSTTGYYANTWFLEMEQDGWSLQTETVTTTTPTSKVELDADTSWRHLTRGIDKEEASRHVKIEGDEKLGKHFLDMVSIIV